MNAPENSRALGSRKLLDWLDERTRYRQLLAPLGRRVLPHGPSWWYSTANCLLWLLVTQFVTGLALMASYSPSVTTAWGSVQYIEHTTAGAFLRGLHYYSAQALIVLLVIHLVRVLLAAAFRAPRELIWITGLLLLPLLLVWTITGNPLSGTLEGMSQIEVEGNIIGSTPGIGATVREILIGGDQTGHLTLTHLYFLHVGLMPLLVGSLLALHISQVYRHGVAGANLLYTSGRPCPYFPYQTVRNRAVLFVVLCVLATLAYHFGAPLGPPADPDLPQTPRPEWYFLWLFELRRYFTGSWEFVATIVIPSVLLLALLFMPSLDRRTSPRISFAIRLFVVVAGVAGWSCLTGLSLWRDAGDLELKETQALAAQLGERAREIAAAQGIPPAGPRELLQRDPQSMGPLLFRKHCLSCHSHVTDEGAGLLAAEPTAPNLYRFGTADWIAHFLDPEQIRSPHVFGNTKFARGDMSEKIAELYAAAKTSEEVATLRQQLLLAAKALAAEANVPAQGNEGSTSEESLAQGRRLIAGTLACTDCHKFHDGGELGDAPDLTGYGSLPWLTDFIANPKQKRFYGAKNDRMPAFAADRAHPARNLLSAEEIELLARWLRDDDEPLGQAQQKNAPK